MKTINLKLYTFDELDESAKNKVIESWRENDEYFWNNENNESLKEFCELFNIKISDYDYGYRKYINASFNLDSEILELSGIRAAKWLYNNFKKSLFKPKTYYGKNYAKKRNSKIFIDSDCILTGYYIDNYLVAPIHEFINKPNNSSIENVLNDCLESWLSACKKDYDYWLSRESIIEDMNCNEYMFLENGKLATNLELMAA